MASSSSSIASPKLLLYDAFISHRGPDVKETLAKHLYHLLRERGCRAFLDRPEIQVGDSITLAIRNGICSSLVQIAIFSPGYAESSWCLDELDLMLKQTDAVFIPVFYDVEPWELRHIENPKSRYANAFSVYRSKGRYTDHKLDEWEKALQSAADKSGYELCHSASCFASCFEWIWPSNLENLCENIVSRVLQVVQERKNRILRDVAKYPVGLDERVQEFDISCSETQRDKVMIAGIYGLGGSGKTTLAAELFNRKSSGYHASCFLSDVRESHARCELHRLQSQLIEDLLKIEGLKIRDVRDGIGKLKQYLERARESDFLIVLDDIDHLDQLDALLPQGMLSSRSLNCRGLKSLPSLAHQRHLEQFTIGGCDELQSVEGFEEWQGLKSLAIEVPDNGYAWVRNCIYGLKMLPSEKTILAGKPVDTASSRLDVNLFSEVAGIEAVVEMQRGEHHRLHMWSSSNAITLNAFLATSFNFGFTYFGPIYIPYGSQRMITVLIPQHNNSEVSSELPIELNKGFMAVVNKREEGKALTLMQRIVDQLYQ